MRVILVNMCCCLPLACRVLQLSAASVLQPLAGRSSNTIAACVAGLHDQNESETGETCLDVLN